VSIARTVLFKRELLELRTKAAALDSSWIAPQDLKLSLVAVTPELDVESVSTETEIEHSQVGQAVPTVNHIRRY
jgi:hypothetical protein